MNDGSLIDVTALKRNARNNRGNACCSGDENGERKI